MMESTRAVAAEVWSFLSDVDFASTATMVILVLTALAAISQARSVAQGNTATFFVNYSARYSAAEMAGALRQLAAWHNRNKGDERRFELWSAEKRGGADSAQTLNEARRLVSRFYYDVAELYGLGLIKKKMAKRLLANNGLNVFYHVCDPMNRVYEPSDRFDRYCNTLRKLSRGFGNGEIFDPDEVAHSRSAAGH